jgi:hypothetical protein
MTADTDELAKRIAIALVKVLPTAKWDAELAAEVTGALGNSDASRATTLADELRVSRDMLDRADLERREWVEEEIYVRWRNRLAGLLAAEPALREPAERVLEALLAAGGGVRGRRRRGREYMRDANDERPADLEPPTTWRERRVHCESLKDGKALGEAATAAREAVSCKPGDPTWLAYAVYGDPLARMTTGNP